MPLYDAACPLCNGTVEYLATMAKSHLAPECDRCGVKMEKVILTAPSVRSDLNDFSTENNGKGRFNKQLMTHVTSKKDAITKAKARGWEILDQD